MSKPTTKKPKAAQAAPPSACGCGCLPAGKK